jgi:hypothetical protein
MQLDAMRDAQRLAAFGGVRLTAGPDGRRPYRSAVGMALVVRVLTLTLGLLATIVGLALVLTTVMRVPWLSASRFDEVESMSTAVRTEVAVAALVALAALAFLAWVVRSYRNLEPLGVRGQRASVTWAAVVWFIPLVNLVVPKEIVDDLYRGSNPAAPLLSASWRLDAVPLRLQLWWVSVVGSMVAMPIAVLAFREAYGDGTTLAVTALAVGHLLVGTASFATWGLVGEVTTRQQRRLDRLGVAPSATERRVDGPDVVELPEPADAPVPVADLGRVLVHGGTDAVWGRY